MAQNENVVTLFWNNRPTLPTTARHQVIPTKLDVGPKDGPNATVTFVNTSRCDVRVCFARPLFEHLDQEPDLDGFIYHYKDIPAGTCLELRAEKGGNGGTGNKPVGYEFRFRDTVGMKGCIDYKPIGSMRNVGPLTGPGDDPQIIIGG